MSYPYVVQLRDTDAAGVVYFANLLAICHGAYESSLAAAGIDLKTFVTNPPIALPIVHASIDFKRPIYCGDRLQIVLNAELQGQSGFSINYQVLQENSEVVAMAITKHLAIDASTRQRVALPLSIHNWLQVFLVERSPLQG